MAKEDDIIMLVVFGMLFVVLIATLISDMITENEEFRIKSNDTQLNRKCNNCDNYDEKFLEHYANIGYANYEPDYGWLSNRGLLPWWNSTRFTRNTSYDLRGDIRPDSPICGYNPVFWNSPIKPSYCY